MDVIGLVENKFKEMLSKQFGIEEVIRGVDYEVIDKPLQGKYGQYVVFTEPGGKEEMKVLFDIGVWMMKNDGEIEKISAITSPIEVFEDFQLAMLNEKKKNQEKIQIFGLN